uniref:Uncharacterized protein n=1 Tax=Rhizophora mucronata TaxID=61149 RepID=A0A2P2PVZ3_RHIMU
MDFVAAYLVTGIELIPTPQNRTHTNLRETMVLQMITRNGDYQKPYI